VTLKTLSIIVPVYNAQATLARTLSSLEHIAECHRPAVQVIVINDGSTDESARIALSAQQRLPTFEWVQRDQENLGLSRARNAALRIAEGEWLWFLDADDELLLDPVTEISSAMEATCIGFAVEYYRYRKRLRRIAPRQVDACAHLDVFSSENPFQPSALVFKRSGVTHEFDSTVEVVNDWLFWMQNPRIFDRMRLAEACIARIHIHGGNMSRRFAVAGRNRAEVARRFLTERPNKLSRRQRNNFFIQQQIGRMQQNQRPSPRTFAAWPCEQSLYLKSLAYALGWLLHIQVTPY
jgi:Glycosyl transferase family 2